MENFYQGIITVLLFLISIFIAYKFYKNEKFKKAIIFILLAGALLRVFTMGDRYFHQWDEKFHALVAKNLIEHPLKQTLVEHEIIPYPPENWKANHIWLEKGPVPLHSIALSIYLFGKSPFVVRMPSLLISLLAVYLTYLIALLLFNQKIALLAAFFHTINGSLAELVGGRASSDHVENFFIFFVELSIYLCIYQVIKQKGLWMSVLIGLATAMAILSKWFPALIVFPVWTIGYFSLNKKISLQFVKEIVIAITVSSLIVVPYFYYLYSNFPIEFSYVFQKFIFAYSNTVDQFDEPFYYYIIKLTVVYGELVLIPLAIGLFLTFKPKFDWRLVTILAWWLIPLIIFSMASTKRFTYLYISAPAVFIMLSYVWFYLLDLSKKNRYKWLILSLLVLIVVLPLRHSSERIKPFDIREREPAYIKEINALDFSNYPIESTALFNLEHNIEIMYATGYTAYNFIPNPKLTKRLLSKGYTIVINDNSLIDDEIRNQRMGATFIYIAAD